MIQSVYVPQSALRNLKGMEYSEPDYRGVMFDERYLTQLCSGIILLIRCLHITALTPVTAKSFADISSRAEPGDKRESNIWWLFHKFFNYAWKFRVKRITFGIYLLHFSYYPQKLVCVQMAHKSRVGRPWDVGSMVDWSSHAEGGCIWHWATADAPKVQRWMWWRGLLMPMQNRQYFLQIKQNKRDNHSHVLDVSSDKILHNSRRLFGWKNNGAMEPT